LEEEEGTTSARRSTSTGLRNCEDKKLAGERLDGKKKSAKTGAKGVGGGKVQGKKGGAT